MGGRSHGLLGSKSTESALCESRPHGNLVQCTCCTAHRCRKQAYLVPHCAVPVVAPPLVMRVWRQEGVGGRG